MSGDIGMEAAAAAAQLRAMTEAAADVGALSALENEVFRYHHHVAALWAETDRLLAATPRRASLTALASSWRTQRIEGVDLQAVVDERVQQLEADLQTIERLRQSWSWNLDRTDRVGSPGFVVERVEATLGAIEATREQIERQKAPLLLLQDTLGRSVTACDEAAARIAAARRLAIKRVFVAHGLPIWRIRTAWAERTAQVGEAGLSARVAAQLDSLRVYFQAYRSGFVFTLLFLLVSTLIMYRMRATLRAAGSVTLPESVAHIVRVPLATALLFTVICTRPLRPDPPLALQQLTILILFPPALVLLRPLLDPRLVPALYALAVLLVIDIGRAFLFAAPVVEQGVLILEMGAAAALLFWVAARIPTAAGRLAQLSPWLRAAGRGLFRTVAIAALAAAAAAALGYLELADFVGSGGLDLIYMAIGLLSVRTAAAGVFGLALLKTPLARLRVVERHGARIEHAVGRALDVTMLAFWVFMALQLFELQTPVVAALRGALAARLRVGELDFPLGRLLSFAAVVVLAWLAARLIVFALEEDVYPRLQLPRGVPYALSSLTRYGLLLVGFLLALGTVGLDLTRVTILVSAFGLGIGFGLQQVVNNFVSGLILLFERPVQVGDSVQLGDLLGEVTRIGIRSSTIRTFEGAEVVVPNSSMIEEKVTNWTLSDRKRRVDLNVGVAYGTDAARVIALLVEVARQVPEVVIDPAPEAFFVGFGDSSLDFQLRVWTVQPRWVRLRSDLGVALQRALRDAGIEVPFPQRDVHVRGVAGPAAAPAAQPPAEPEER